jgi:hypothetical protein
MQHEFFDEPPTSTPKAASAPRATQTEPKARQRTVYSVSALNREVRLLIESGIGSVWV